MIENMTTLISGIITAVTDLINPTTGTGNATAAVAYAGLLAMPVLAGVVAFARRLVKKAKN